MYFEFFFRIVALLSFSIIALWYCSYLYHKITQRYSGKSGLLLTGFLGVPFHEVTHVLMALIFGHKINKIVFFRYKSSEPTLGWVEHSYNRHNIFSSLGVPYIAIAPIIFLPFLIGVTLTSINIHLGHQTTQVLYSWIISSDNISLAQLTDAVFLDFSLLDLISLEDPRLFTLLFLGCLSLHSAPSKADIHTIDVSLISVISLLILTVFIYISSSFEFFFSYLGGLTQTLLLSVLMLFLSLFIDLSGLLFRKLFIKMLYTKIAK